jgi:hypothetical protein
LVIAAPLLIVIAGLVAMTWLDNRADRSRAASKRLQAHETFLREQHTKALLSADIDPTAALFAHDIGKHLATTHQEITS